MTEKYRPGKVFTGRYVVEGELFRRASDVFQRAKLFHAFQGSVSVITYRLTRGKDTWAELCAPVNENVSKAHTGVERRKHEEMAAIIAALDARKKAME